MRTPKELVVWLITLTTLARSQIPGRPTPPTNHTIAPKAVIISMASLSSANLKTPREVAPASRYDVANESFIVDPGG
jgi:hypothetical protein